MEFINLKKITEVFTWSHEEEKKKTIVISADVGDPRDKQY